MTVAAQICAAIAAASWLGAAAVIAGPRTEVAIKGEDFLINGEPTYRGRVWKGHRIEGLLMNSRMVQATFDDLNPATVSRWAYPDTGKWDAERNTREFIAAMPEWRQHGLLAVTLNLQGGSPQGYSKEQPWINSAYEPNGALREDYLSRLERILTRADELGMVVILGLFYFGQDERLTDEAAVIRAGERAVRWVLERGYRNVLIEVANETDIKYNHRIFDEDRTPGFIERLKGISHEGRRLLVGTSFSGGKVPWDSVVKVSDFLLIHGNGQSSPAKLTTLIQRTRMLPSFRPMPVVVNEDDHFEFEAPENNFVAAIREHVSWGYFDFRKRGEPFEEGFQSVPVDWSISSARKRGFFELLREITGSSR